MGWIYNGSAELDGHSNYPTIIGSIMATTIVMVAVVFARFYVRLRLVRGVGADDWLVLASTIGSLIYAIGAIVQTRWGLGLPMREVPKQDRVELKMLNYSFRSFYCIAVCCWKIALCHSYLQITTNSQARTIRRLTWAAMGFCIIFTIYYTLTTAFECHPVSKYIHNDPAVHTFIVNALSFSPDSYSLASASSDDSIRIWNARTGEQIHVLKGHNSRVVAVKFSTDSLSLVSGSWDRTARLWDLTPIEDMGTVEGHTERVNGVKFSPDGSIVASVAADWTVRLWNVHTGEQITSWPTYGIKDILEFSDDGLTVYTDIETFEIDVSMLPTVTQIPSKDTLELKDQWLLHRGKEIFWLPFEYRGTCSAVLGNTIVIGQASGAISFLRVSDTTFE
ncbi:WD40 repeat-like protein [Myriangium duriaei CBS 260.36]|uniref:WD40 repeat-like protein n=1 Tax=Myriangium duriaei CBS 260.36 TaxID=1168546 RepID=A0A9P4MC93_9PEZI|nr:WD40 repeat-like protein [Myriangium duriaei CBS 260.36]